MASIRVTPTPLYADRISPLIYGDFVEFVNDLIPSMWAERVRDRCFAGLRQPRHLDRPEVDWTAPRWTSFVAGRPQFRSHADVLLDPPMATASFELDRDEPFVGEQSARVTVVGGDSDHPSVAGILQEGIAVRQGERLKVEVWARGRGRAGVPLRVQLGTNHGVLFDALGDVTLDGLGESWRKLSGEITAAATSDDASLAIGIDRPGTFWLGKVSLMPVDNQLGWRTDVVEAIRVLKPGIIRFGGSSLIYYQWEQGLGSDRERAPFVNQPWGNLEENDVGLFEFLQFCELVGAEPLVCVNSNSSSLPSILDEIEFCNGPAASRQGAIRAAMGHPEPFQVRYWQIGNEQKGEEYEQTLAAYATAMRRAHPDLVLMASYPSDSILLNLSEQLDYICPHLYHPYSPVMEEGVRDLIRQIRDSAANRQLKLGITEWNHTGGHWGASRTWLLTHFNALNAARMLNLFHRLGDAIRIACRSNMANSSRSGGVQTSGTDLYLTPCYHVMRAYANLAGDTALTYDASADEGLDVSATRSSATGDVTIFVVNDTREEQCRSIDLTELSALSGEALVWTLTGASLDAVNSFARKNNVAPVESRHEHWNASTPYAFPPFSLTVLRFPAAPGE